MSARSPALRQQLFLDGIKVEMRTGTHRRRVVILITAVVAASLHQAPASAPQDTPPWAQFGVSVAAVPDAIFVAASPMRGAKRGPGEVHVFERSESRWVRAAELSVPEATIEDLFGISMAADGDTLVVGAQFADARGKDSGLAYVFERRAARWHQAAVLSASDAAAGDQFGLTVSVRGETIVVGARLADSHGVDAGAAYVFTRHDGRWQQAAKLMASDAAAGDLFGRVSIGEHVMVVSADLNDDRGSNAGKAYAFESRAGVWTEVATLAAKDGTAGDEFGVSLALTGDTAVFGAIGSDSRGEDSGAAYVFERRQSQWTQAARLSASDGARRQQFGSAVAADAGTIVVGAPDDGGKGKGAGAAYVFERGTDGWTEAAKLTASDAAAASWFGSTVAVSGNTIVVGMHLNGEGKRPGAAYVFERRQGAWSEVARLGPAGAAP